MLVILFGNAIRKYYEFFIGIIFYFSHLLLLVLQISRSYEGGKHVFTWPLLIFQEMYVSAQ